jgi:hypothetical protein
MFMLYKQSVHSIQGVSISRRTPTQQLSIVNAYPMFVSGQFSVGGNIDKSLEDFPVQN